MAGRRIFVSCGQLTDDENALGTKVLRVIEAHGMQGFFARDVHSASGLNAEVFEALRTCDAFVAIMHRRGEVRFLDYAPCHRASTWVQQEIAILCYRIHAQGRPVPIRVYADPDIRLEGVMAAAIVNPIPFTTERDVLDNLATWLEGAEFSRDPVVSRRESLFARKTQNFSDVAWEILSVIAAESTAPGIQLRRTRIDSDLREVLNRPDREIDSALGDLFASGIVESRVERDVSYVWIAPAFFDLVVGALRERGEAG